MTRNEESCSDDELIKAIDIKKVFRTYNRKRDRLKQIVSSNGKHFKEFVAVDGASFTLERGETLGIVGKNGSGKSTLLQLICGTLKPTSGQIIVNGRIGALLELGSGFNPEFTGRENVYLNGALLGIKRSEIDDRIKDIEEFADIGDYIDQPVKTYSSGMVVRLAFSVITSIEADILVIDEALAVGDLFFTQKCMRYLKKI